MSNGNGFRSSRIEEELPILVTASGPDNFGNSEYLPPVSYTEIIESPILVTASGPDNFGQGDYLPSVCVVREWY